MTIRRWRGRVPAAGGFFRFLGCSRVESKRPAGSQKRVSFHKVFVLASGCGAELFFG